MPILQIDTNLSMDMVPLDFRVKTCELLVELFKVPLKFCVVHINTQQDLYWHGLNGPCAIGVLKILKESGKINPEKNNEYAEKLVKHISDNLKLSDQNITISFVEQKAANVTTGKITVQTYLQNTN